MWGCHWAGGIVSPANPGYTAEELAFQLKDSGAKAICTQKPFLEVVLKAAKTVGLNEDRIILMGEEKDTSYRFKHWTAIRNVAGTSRYRRVKRDAATDLAFLPYSSGTTGRPKGVMLSHRNIAANTLQNAASESVNMTWQNDRIMACLPFFHIYGMSLCHRVRLPLPR
jgi:4-coumarate--CoA ligase